MSVDTSSTAQLRSFVVFNDELPDALLKDRVAWHANYC